MRRSVWLLIACAALLSADDAWATDGLLEERAAAIRRAVQRGVPVLQTAARNYPKHRKCFSCHHQTLPLLGIVSARDAELTIDAELVQSQIEFTRRSFHERIDTLKAGGRIGGRAMTAAYGLWTLQIAQAPSSDVSEALVSYLLQLQEPDGRWRPQPPSGRPPLEESTVTCTVLAAYGMSKYAAKSQEPQVQAAIKKAEDWLATADLESQEDFVMRLWGLHQLGANPSALQEARAAVRKTQRDDGGFSQQKDMESDAYATGQTLFVLLQTGSQPTDPEIERAVDFLLNSQCEDGSWLVETRSKPVQIYFDNGDPHGKNQFISITATGWAVAALASCL